MIHACEDEVWQSMFSCNCVDVKRPFKTYQGLICRSMLNLANMRSNDLVFGMCNDIFTFCLFQQLMLNELRSSGMDVTLGEYFHHAGSMHVYERHYEMVKKVVSQGPYEDPESKFSIDRSFTMSDCISLPGIDLSKREIGEYVNHAKGLLFDEHS